MRKNKLLLLLALLLTAATGAWAEDIVISPASGADISTALATATDGKTVGNITINLAQNGAYTVSSAMEVPAGLTINGNGATINAESLTEGNGMFLGTGKDSPTRADIQISDLTIKSLGKSLYYSNGQKNYGDFIMNNCLVEVTSSVIVFNYTKGSAVVNFTLTNSTFYAPTATTTQFYSSQSGQKLTEIIIDANQEFSFQNCTLYNMAKNKNFFSHRQNSQKWLSYEAKNSIFVNCGKSGEVVKGMNGGYTNVNPTWSIDGNLFNYDGADTSANETTGDTSEGEGVQNSVAGVVTFKDPSNGDFSGIITKSDNSTVDLTLGDPRWTAAAEPATYTVSLKDDVKDADKWTITPNPATAGQTVTLQYNGRLKVKGVKATSDEKPAAPASTTLNNTITAWTAGSYVVPSGGVTYSNAITVSGDVTLTLTDGQTLTLNNGISLAEGATLTIQGNGTMNINGTDGNTSSTVGGNHGTLVLTSGTLTATGGNGGSVDVVESGAHGGNGGVAINGSVIVSGGSLTARGGNGGSVDYQCTNCSGGNGGDAISGSVTVSGGTLTATGGNGGSVGDYGSDCSGGNGGDAISGTLTKNGGSTSGNDGSNGSIGNMCDNCTAGTGGKGHN